MSANDIICEKCGSPMTQTSSDMKHAAYHCKCCGNNVLMEMSMENNADYWHMRTELLQRVRVGIMEWQTTGWDNLAHDIASFMGRNEKANHDVNFKIATIACITSGFHCLNEERYRECKVIFKITEKAYKIYLKNPPMGRGFASPEDADTYKEYRAMYKKCRADYRNTKALWKMLYTIAEKFLKLPIPF
jgi:predicted  nucleic acid-binding Zn-ribbon protein